VAAPRAETPVFGQDDAFQILKVPSTLEMKALRESKYQKEAVSWERMDTAISDLTEASILDLGLYLPEDVLRRRHVLNLIKGGALYQVVPEDQRIILYSVKYHGGVRTRHFLWLLPTSDSSAVLSASLALI
jgi:hypothetical protein